LTLPAFNMPTPIIEREMPAAQTRPKAERLTRGIPVLEIRGGTGYQAKVLGERGFDVTPIDLHDGYHMPNLVFSCHTNGPKLKL
jgi:hypothetical protein